MLAQAEDRPPYRAALAVFVAVLVGYLASLAPTVTFWDAGEFIAAARTLGIPHPPGTPFFVMVAHVWALLVPVGEFAWRTNLLSAVAGAAGAALWFLVAHQVTGPMTRGLAAAPARLVRVGGATAAALIAPFGFTTWQNANETEVYGIATLTIALVVWLAFRWRAQRGSPAASRMLLLAVYLGGLSIGNHLLALLVGPALVAFLAHVLRTAPAEDPAVRRSEWAEVAVVAGTWTLLIGVGLGSPPLVFAGGVMVGAAGVLAWRAGVAPFAGLAGGLALAGVTTYLFLLIRAGQQPVINEADPSTWSSLLSVIRREQYPPRTPFDDPTEPSGPDNPGRTLVLLGLQLLNYVQYFDWQWAKGVTATLGDIPLRSAATLCVIWLGLRGAAAHRAADRSSWWLVAGLFTITGLGLVLYMNFKPGFSIGYLQYPEAADHEVRERDYFFVVSFLVWGVWAGLGLAQLVIQGVQRGRRPMTAALVFGLAVLPFAANFRAASRRHGPDARLAADFAYNLLNSMPPHGILFTYGDNDTFPLWWAQEVEGIRQDVTVVCLALAETDWYMRQLRDLPARPFSRAGAAALWAEPSGPLPERVHTMTDEEIALAVPQYLPADLTLRVGTRDVILPRGTLLYGKDFATLRILRENVGRRPVAWALSAVGRFYGLDSLLVQQGLVVRVMEAPVAREDPRYDHRAVMGAPLDLVTTEALLFGVYRYADLLQRPSTALEPTARYAAGVLAVPFSQMATALEARGDSAGIRRYLEPAAALSGNPALREALEEAGPPDAPPGQTLQDQPPLR